MRACLYDIDVSLLLHAALPGANSQNPARYSTRDLVNSPFHTHAHAHILFPAARPARATTRLFHTHARTRTHIVPGSAACKSDDTSIPHTRTHVVPGSAACKSDHTSIPPTRTRTRTHIVPGSAACKSDDTCISHRFASPSTFMATLLECAPSSSAASRSLPVCTRRCRNSAKSLRYEIDSRK